MIVIEIMTGVVLWSVGCFALGYLVGAQPRSREQ